MMWLVTAILAGADQITKYLAERFLMPAQNVDLIPNMLSLTYVENKGAAFGILQNARWFFVIVTLLAVGALVLYALKARPQSKLFKWSATLICGGAVGNLIDRIAYGYVIDMIRVHFFDFPVFNFADCCVVSGAVLFCIFVLVNKEEIK